MSDESDSNQSHSDLSDHEDEMKDAKSVPAPAYAKRVADALLDAGKKQQNGAVENFVVEGLIPNDLVGIYSPGLVLGDKHFFLPVLDEKQIEYFITKGLLERAPFGRGEATILDLEVRKTWQAKPESVRFANPRFQKDVQTLAERAASLLDINTKTVPVTTNFHKMLIYGEGDFFKPHRDAVHTPNQFATLVIQLPSQYTGGALCVKHGDHEVKVEQGRPESVYQPMFTAFYADCLHEVLPVGAKGYRTCLTFDLCYRSLQSASPTIKAADSDTDDEENDTKRSRVELSASGSHDSEVLSALEEWHDTVVASALSIGEGGAYCRCGIPKTSSAPNDEDDEEIDEDDEWNSFRPFSSTKAHAMVIVLDHMLPKNEVGYLINEGIEGRLWTLRGNDRHKAIALLRAIDALKAKEKIIKAEFGSFTYDSDDGVRMDSAVGENLEVCRCMLHCFSEQRVRQIVEFTGDTGNEGEKRIFRYEFSAIILYPEKVKTIVCRELSAVDVSNAVKFFENEYVEDKLQLALLFKGHWRGNIVGAIERHVPLQSLFVPELQSLVGRPHQDPTIATEKVCWCKGEPFDQPEPNERLAFLISFFRDRLNNSELPHLASHYRGVGEMTAMVLSCVACQGTSNDDASAARCLVHMLLLLPTAYASFAANLFSSRFTSHFSKAQAATMLFQESDKLPESILDVVIRENLKLAVDLVNNAAENQRGIDHTVEALADLIKILSAPGHKYYAQALTLAEIVSNYPLKTLKNVVRRWFNYGYSNKDADNKWSGTVVMHAVVDAYCILHEASLDEELKQTYHKCDAEQYLGQELIDFLKSGQEHGTINAASVPKSKNRYASSRHDIASYHESDLGFKITSFPTDLDKFIVHRTLDAYREERRARQKGDRNYLEKLRTKIVWQ